MARVVAAGQENFEELWWEAASVNDEAIPWPLWPPRHASRFAHDGRQDQRTRRWLSA